MRLNGCNGLNIVVGTSWKSAFIEHWQRQTDCSHKSWSLKKAKRRWTWIASNVESKNDTYYMLIDAWSILKDVSAVPLFNIRSDLCMLLLQFPLLRRGYWMYGAKGPRRSMKGRCCDSSRQPTERWRQTLKRIPVLCWETSSVRKKSWTRPTSADEFESHRS